MTNPALPLTSFKLQFVEGRVRIVPARGLDGCPFKGPGVDLVGADARAAIAQAAPVIDWLAAREPGIAVRSLSIDLSRGRVLLTYAHGAAPTEARPHVLRIDAPASSELIDLARPLLAYLADAAVQRLGARTTQS